MSSYNPSGLSKWYKFWEENKLFDPNGKGEPFCMVLPPPNVTGVLHIGHALNQTLQDIIARYKRMKGFDVLWIPGTDHAGIATQNVVEKALAKKEISRFDLGREKFVERVWEWKADYGDKITEQIRMLGSSLSWSYQRFTMDNDMSLAVKTVFVTLYNKGLIYKGSYIVNWCPRCLTALSDLEVEHKEQSGSLWFLKYVSPDNPEDSIVVATTRPETLFGDSAVAVNPTDDRYKKFIGKTVIVPIVNREIPVIADSYVDIGFGTGALKITPACDPNDFDVAKRHSLSQISVFTKDAKMNENAMEFVGLDRYECRKKVIEKLQTEGLLIKEEPHIHSVGQCYRCRTDVEPLVSEQWFVKTKEMARMAKAAVNSKDARFIPNQWTKTFYEWMDNIRDWCISRQIWWGHRIPVYYCDKCGKMAVSIETQTICPECGGDMHQDEDVLDTWFSSALWPFSTLGWPKESKLLKRFYPNSLVVTGFDIIFFWIARMMMMGLTFMDEVPFKDIYIHALVRDEHNQKMSKSKGNVIDPEVIISKYGADSLRFTLASLAGQGRDIVLSEARIEGFKHFLNKIWNAFRLVKKLVGSSKIPDLIENRTIAMSWIISESNFAVKECGDCLEQYKFNDAANVLYQFVWHKFCDVYLEIAKDEIEKFPEETKFVLVYITDIILRALHPFIPFITEELWQQMEEYFPDRTAVSILQTKFPECGSFDYKDEHHEMEMIIKVSSMLRSLKSDLQIPTKNFTEAEVKGGGAEIVYANADYIKRLSFANLTKNLIGAHRTGNLQPNLEVSEVIIAATDEQKKEAAVKISEKMNILNKRIKVLKKRLNNRGFLEHAEASVVSGIKKEYLDDFLQVTVLKKRISEMELDYGLEFKKGHAAC